MTESASSEGTDKGVGLSLLLSVLAGLGAIAMLVTAPASTAAWGFAAAIAFAALAVVAIHLYWAE